MCSSVDQQTDKIFKSFLKQDGGVSPKIGKTSTRNRQLHFSGRSAITQLRRQVMRKQYSDSIAMYYGQRMRRMRVEKQVSKHQKDAKANTAHTTLLRCDIPSSNFGRMIVSIFEQLQNPIYLAFQQSIRIEKNTLNILILAERHGLARASLFRDLVYASCLK